MSLTMQNKILPHVGATVVVVVDVVVYVFCA